MFLLSVQDSHYRYVIVVYDMFEQSVDRTQRMTPTSVDIIRQISSYRIIPRNNDVGKKNYNSKSHPRISPHVPYLSITSTEQLRVD